MTVRCITYARSLWFVNADGVIIRGEWLFPGTIVAILNEPFESPRCSELVQCVLTQYGTGFILRYNYDFDLKEPGL